MSKQYVSLYICVFTHFKLVKDTEVSLIFVFRFEDQQVTDMYLYVVDAFLNQHNIIIMHCVSWDKFGI